MKKSDLPPGTKVIASMSYGNEFGDDNEDEIVRYTYDEYDDNTLIGVVRSEPAKGNKVVVKWIEGDREEEQEEVDVAVLALASSRPELEKEFKTAQKAIKDKLKEAAKIVKEANIMAKKAGAKNLESMYDAIDPLIDAMDASGWRSSSWGC